MATIEANGDYKQKQGFEGFETEIAQITFAKTKFQEFEIAQKIFDMQK